MIMDKVKRLNTFLQGKNILQDSGQVSVTQLTCFWSEYYFFSVLQWLENMWLVKNGLCI